MCGPLRYLQTVQLGLTHPLEMGRGLLSLAVSAQPLCIALHTADSQLKAATPAASFKQVSPQIARQGFGL